MIKIKVKDDASQNLCAVRTLPLGEAELVLGLISRKRYNFSCSHRLPRHVLGLPNEIRLIKFKPLELEVEEESSKDILYTRRWCVPSNLMFKIIRKVNLKVR